MKTWIKITLWLTGAFVVLLLGLGIAFYTPDLSADEIEKKYITKESFFIQMQDCRLHYRMRGEGPVILLIHGSFASLNTWNDWEEVLSKTYTTLSVDLPGHGLTGPNRNGDYSLDYYSKLLLQLSDSLGIDSLAVAGNSLGGGVAWRMALDAPKKVNKLILIDPQGFNKNIEVDTIPTKTPLIFKLRNSPLLGNALVNFTPKFLFEYNIKQVYGDSKNIKEGVIDRYIELMLREGNRKATIQRIKKKPQPRFDELSNINKPTLILWGIKDKWIPVEQAYAFKDKLEHAELILYPKLGHIPMEEGAEETLKDALNFLAQ